ncbi:unnamed protein product [Prorocentrum cordatum]|uniref:Uncharacterized protein n=1 Tax=Prorocentrum cordatum TaxID=2364126 RepID=A0ABN9XY05_9DINO|nr:unnamed protein product [Polarella glacialis]
MNAAAATAVSAAAAGVKNAAAGLSGERWSQMPVAMRDERPPLARRGQRGRSLGLSATGKARARPPASADGHGEQPLGLEDLAGAFDQTGGVQPGGDDDDDEGSEAIAPTSPVGTLAGVEVEENAGGIQRGANETLFVTSIAKALAQFAGGAATEATSAAAPGAAAAVHWAGGISREQLLIEVAKEQITAFLQGRGETWGKCEDPDGREFYRNKDTGKMTLHAPQGVPAGTDEAQFAEMIARALAGLAGGGPRGSAAAVPPGATAAASAPVVAGGGPSSMGQGLQDAMKDLAELQKKGEAREMLQGPSGRDFYRNKDAGKVAKMKGKAQKLKCKAQELKDRAQTLQDKQGAQKQQGPVTAATPVEGGATLSPDMARAKPTTRSQLADALAAWEGVLRAVADSSLTWVTLTFSPGFKDARAFHDTVAAMGAQARADSAAGAAAPRRKLPYAAMAGDVHQPRLIVIWKAAPEERASMQFPVGKGILTVKSRRGIVVGRAQLFAAFFGPAVDAMGPAPRGRGRGGEVGLLKALPR